MSAKAWTLLMVLTVAAITWLILSAPRASDIGPEDLRTPPTERIER